MWDLILLDANAATMDGDELGLVEDCALGIEGGRIAWIGKREDLPGEPSALARELRHLDGAWITPGLIDCHTHLVYGGDRADEFQRRLAGEAYESIARSGGGIASSIRGTRAADLDELTEGALARLDCLLAEGVTTVEVKSGYGGNLETERRQLVAAGRLADLRRVRVRRTFLGLHALPPEANDRQDFVDLVVDEMLPALHADGLVDAVDAFCEGIAFDCDEVERFFAAAQDLGLPVKLHAEQLSDCGGAELAARRGALSADHLERLGPAGVESMAQAGTVAVLLPGAYYYLRDTQAPPVELLRQHGVPMAVATDHNPGSSPLLSLLAAANMACLLFGLTVVEALRAITVEASRALGLQSEVGRLATGLAADLAIWRISAPVDLIYRLGDRPLRARVVGGRYIGE